MGTVWTSEKISQYHTFMASFISGYTDKIDCADLALEGLVEFAYQNGLPIKLKYYKKGKSQYYMSPQYESMDETKLNEAIKGNVGAVHASMQGIIARNV